MAKRLFEDDEPENAGSAFQVNESFAKKYEERKRAAELRALEEKYAQRYKEYLQKGSTLEVEENDNGEPEGSESDSSSDESDVLEDEEGAEWLAQDVDIKLLNTIAKIRAKDEQIYDHKPIFEKDAIESKCAAWQAKKQAEKNGQDSGMSLKDYHAKLLKEDFHAKDEELQQPPLTYIQEQNELKKETKSAFFNHQDEDDQSDFFTQKTATEVSNRDLLQQIDLKPEDETDAFLVDYLLKKAWIPKKKKGQVKEEAVVVLGDEGILDDDEGILDDDEGILDDDEGILDDDEEQLEDAEEFETTLNLRYEPEAKPVKIQNGVIFEGEQLVGHARSLPGVRREDDSRKRQRQNRLEKKRLERERELEDLKRLKNLKRLEMMEKMNEISSISGKNCLDVDLRDILDDEKDFDLEDYDRKMNILFNEDYYQIKEKDKEFFKETEEYIKGLSGDEEENEMQASLDKPHRNNKSSIIDDYSLDFEDRIKGFGATRFRYRPVLPSSFGLQVTDILEAEDSSLNSLVSLKKLAAYKDQTEQSHDIGKYSKKKRLRQFYHGIQIKNDISL